jgi:hypothetical protein
MNIADQIFGLMMAGFDAANPWFFLYDANGKPCPANGEDFADFGPLEIIDFFAQHYGAAAAKEVAALPMLRQH